MNLTPTEKAKELVLQFYKVVKNKYPSTSGMPLAKQCALIAVEEILEITQKPVYVLDDFGDKKQTGWENNSFWFAVFQEILKL